MTTGMKDIYRYFYKHNYTIEKIPTHLGNTLELRIKDKNDLSCSYFFFYGGR